MCTGPLVHYKRRITGRQLWQALVKVVSIVSMFSIKYKVWGHQLKIRREDMKSAQGSGRVECNGEKCAYQAIHRAQLRLMFMNLFLSFSRLRSSIFNEENLESTEKSKEENKIYPYFHHPEIAVGCENGTRCQSCGVKPDICSTTLVLEFWLRKNSEPRLGYKRKFIQKVTEVEVTQLSCMGSRSKLQRPMFMNLSETRQCGYVFIFQLHRCKHRHRAEFNHTWSFTSKNNGV